MVLGRSWDKKHIIHHGNLYIRSMSETRKGRTMAVITRTFRGFFEQKFQEEKATRYFRPDCFVTEMAIRHHIRNDMPIKFDDDDLEFLRQFPHDFWVTAKKARYEMLFRAVQGLHNKRHDEYKQKELVQAIVAAMETGEWSHLGPSEKNPEGIVPAWEIAHLKQNSKAMNRNQKEAHAEKLAHEFIRKQTAHVDEPKEAVPCAPNLPPEYSCFTLTSSDTSAKPRKQTFTAKPFLNRLYHKLETTPGEKFHPESGLQGRGKYGFDMTDPIDGKKNIQKVLDDDGDEIKVKGSHLTSGFKFPSADTISLQMGRFLSANASHIFGKLPEDVEWKEMKGKQDTWSAKFVKNQLRKKIEAGLRRTWKGTDPELRTEVNKQVNAELFERVQKGEFRGPPIPGVAPKGFPIGIKMTSKGPKFVNPPLYLPVKKQMIQKVIDGKVQSVPVDVPIVNPAHYLRELGKEESDYEHEYDSQGNERRKYNPETGQPIYKVPEDQLRGYDKSFVHVPDDVYGKQKHMAPGALDANHDSEQVLHMTRGNPKWQETYDKIFQSQQRVHMDQNGKITPDPNGAFYEDIAKGMKKCLWSDACGGATSHEREIFKHDLEGFHSYIVTKMLQAMDDPDLLTPDGRMGFAYNKITTVLQKDQGKGGGPRRMRMINRGTDSRNVSFSGGGDANIEDDLMSRVASSGGKIGKKKRGKGQREWDTSGLATPYNISVMRDAIRKMQQDAAKADELTHTAKELSNHETGVHIIKMIRDGINSQIDFKLFLGNTLGTLYRNTGMSQEEAKETAERLVKGWIDEDGLRTSEQLMSAFQNHPLVKQAIEVGSGDAGKIHPVDDDQESDKELKSALHYLQLYFDNMEEADFEEKDEMKFELLANRGAKYGNFIQELILNKIVGKDNTNVMDRVQAEINRRFNLPAPAASPAASHAAREITPPTKTTAQAEITPPIKPTTLKDKIAQRKGQNQTTPEAQPEPAVAPAPTAPAPAAAPQQVPTPTESVDDLFEKRNWLGLAHHPHYLRNHSSDLTEQKKKLLNYFHTSKDKYQPHEYASAVANLEKSIREGS